MNDVLSSWEEMKIEHIRNAIDAQRGVMLEIIEKQGVLLRFLVPTCHVKREHGNFFKGVEWGSFLKVILMSLIEFQNVFPMINFDVWDRLGHVQTIFDTVGL